ncbi:MAG: 4Fe-4S binding protein [Spirochaetes bacterium]|nr:4Fe-4S binding protein [Spirochaetota bacterium]
MKNRPGITKWKRPEHINDYPVGPGMDAGHLVAGNAGWRTFRPVINIESCTGCYRCYLVCPDGVIFKKNDKIDIDLDFCKGCGVCSYECPANAIDMIKEAEE